MVMTVKESVDMCFDEGMTIMIIGRPLGEVARISAANTFAMSRDTSATSTILNMNEAMHLGITVLLESHKS